MASTSQRRDLRGLTATLVRAVCIFVVFATAVHAGEDGLYGAPVPADAVFIRSLDALDGTIVVFGHSFTADELPPEIYVAISASALQGAEPGSYYSMRATPDGQVVIAEPARDDAAKVYIILLNAGDVDARLVIDGKDAEVIGWTGPNMADARAVNPVTVTLAVETSDGYFPLPVTLRRGQNLTLVVSEGTVKQLPSEFGPVIETR